MLDDDFDDELPEISIKTCESHALLRMPTAEELASERAREVECQRELQALRASNADESVPDSSGSEGETALAAAVTALGVQASARRASASLTDLLTPILSRLPQEYMPISLLECLRKATPAALATLTEDVCDATMSGQLHTAGEAAAAAAWLAAAAAGARGLLRRRSRCALLLLLEHEYFADPDGVASLALRNALIGGNLDENTYLELADVAAAAPVAAPLQRRLLLATLAKLLHIDAPPDTAECGCAWAAEGVAAAWSSLAADAAAVFVRAAGRAARACASESCGPHRATLLATLTTPPPGGSKAPADRLEVLVAAKNVQLLLRDL